MLASELWIIIHYFYEIRLELNFLKQAHCVDHPETSNYCLPIYLHKCMVESLLHLRIDKVPEEYLFRDLHQNLIIKSVSLGKVLSCQFLK